MKRLHASLLVLAATPWIAACSRSEAAFGALPAVSVDSAMAELVPADAVAFMRVPSLDAAQAALDRIRRALPDLEPVRVLDRIAELGVDPASVDPARPAGVAVWIDAAAREPRAVFLLPAKDPAALAAAAPGAVARGGWVGVPGQPGAYAPGGAAHPLAASSAEGDLGLNVDLQRLFALFGDDIEAGLDRVEEEMGAGLVGAPLPVDASAIARGYVGMARGFVDSAESLRVAVRVEGARWEAAATVTAREGSPMASLDLGRGGDVAALARYAELDQPVLMMAKLDFARMGEMLGGLFEALIPGANMFEDFREVYPLYGGATVGSFGFQDGMRMSAVYDARGDAKELLAQQLAAITGGGMADIGMTFAETGTDVVGGLEVHRIAMQLDEERLQAATGQDEQMRAAMAMGMTMMFGGEGLRYALGAEGNRLLMVTGGDDAYVARAVARFRAGDTVLPPDVARALDGLAAADAGMLLRFDVARIALQAREAFGGLMGGAPPPVSEQARSASVPVALVFGVAGRTWSLTTSVVPGDLPKLQELFGGD